MPTEAPQAELSAICSRQHGLITRQQAYSSGFTKRRLESWVSSGRLNLVELQVFHLAGAPFTWHSRVLAACLASGGMASHRTAACLTGYRDFRPGTPELTVARNRRYRAPQNRVHRPSDIDLIRPTVIDGIPVTDPVRVLVDLAAVVSFELLDRTANQFVQRKLGTWSDVLEAHVRHARRGKPGTAAMRALADLHCGWHGATESALEDRLWQLIHDGGLPAPVVQHEIRDAEGTFIMRTDLAWPAYLVAVEADSVAFHLTPAALTEDRVKRAAARRLGWAVHEYTDRLVRERPAWICEDLATTLRDRGAEW